jgi:hypothetical protein
MPIKIQRMIGENGYTPTVYSVYNRPNVAGGGAGQSVTSAPVRTFLCHASITNTVRYTAMSPESFKDIWRD